MTFRDDLAKYAKTMGKDYNILPSFMMAVAILETGDGSSALCKEANNLFSIKGTFNGAYVQMPTTEYVNGHPVRQEANFRKYPNYGDSFKDFCELIKNGVSWNRNIYAPAVIGEKDITTACEQFGKTPYMTDPNYASKLLALVKEYNLTQYDEQPKSKSPAPAKSGSDTTKKTYKSIVNWLDDHNINSSFGNRAKLARLMNITGYTGTAHQNDLMLSNLVKNEGKTYKSIANWMTDSGIHFNNQNETLLSEFLGIKNYSQTGSQNISMLKMLGAQ